MNQSNEYHNGNTRFNRIPRGRDSSSMVNNYKFGDKKYFRVSTHPNHYQLSNQHHTQAIAQHNNSKLEAQQLQEKKMLTADEKIHTVNEFKVTTTAINKTSCLMEERERALCVTQCFPFVFETLNITSNDVVSKKSAGGGRSF